jgi:hypothetical protein
MVCERVISTKEKSEDKECGRGGRLDSVILGRMTRKDDISAKKVKFDGSGILGSGTEVQEEE